MKKIAWIIAMSTAAISCFVPTSATASPVYSTSISGGNTLLDDPWGVTADLDGTIYVADRGAGVLIFAPGSSGNVAPEAYLDRAGAAMSNIFDVELDAEGNVYVGHDDGIAVFAPGSTGDATPIREITGFEAYGIGIGPDSTIYVTLNENDGLNQSGDIYVFGSDASGEAEPDKVLDGSGDSVDVAVDELGNVYLSNYGDASINIWGPDAESGDDPIRTLGGGLSTIGSPYGIDVDCSDGTIVLGNEGTSEILEFASTAEMGDAPLSVVDSGFESQGLGYGQAGDLFVTGMSDGPFVSIYEYDATCQLHAGTESLAETGADAGSMGLGAAALIAAGGIALAVRRRKA